MSPMQSPLVQSLVQQIAALPENQVEKTIKSTNSEALSPSPKKQEEKEKESSKHDKQLKVSAFSLSRLKASSEPIYNIDNAFECGFRNGKFFGKAEISYPNKKKIYRGAFENGVLHGLGEIVFPSKKIWRGTFQNGKFVKGKIIYPNHRVDSWPPNK